MLMEVGLVEVGVEEAGCWLAVEVEEVENPQIARGLVVEVEEKAWTG